MSGSSTVKAWRMCSTDTKFWSRRRDSFNACSRIRWPLSPNLSLYEPKSTISLFYDRRTRFDQHLVRRITRLSNNSALSKLLHLDDASISAVAFQCNNNPGEPSVANLLPLCTKKAQNFSAIIMCFLCLFVANNRNRLLRVPVRLSSSPVNQLQQPRWLATIRRWRRRSVMRCAQLWLDR